MPRIYLERREMSDDLRRLFDLLDDEARSVAPPGECNPPADMIESSESIEVVMDLPGVDAGQIHVAFSGGTIVVAGVKKPHACRHADATFHQAERAFGRFARAFRIAGAVDAGSARATLSAGELRIVVPRIADRRGREIRIAVESV